jgi:paraquat-inducible protein B
MAMGDTQDTGTPEIPDADAQPRKRWHVQIVWLVPLVALLIGAWLAVRAVMEKGPTITVIFSSAEGLEAGKTKFKYKDVDVGQVTAVTVSRNLDRVVVTAELAKELKPYLVDDVRFWVVRPRVAGGSVTGLGTLLAGSYIAIDRGTSKKPRLDFIGLDEPLAIQRDRPGREYTLHSANGGSFGVGSPVLYRQLKVGEVIGNRLAPDGKAILTRIFIDQAYLQYVDANSRFWNASGVDVKVDANGIKVDSQSLAAMLIGGIAFDTPARLPADLSTESKAGTAVASKSEFTLFPDHEAAMKNPESETVAFVLVFRESSRGLLPGAPVELRGVVIGEVVEVALDVDVDSHTIVNRVVVNLYPGRVHFHSRAPGIGEQRTRFIDELVAHGLRAQLNTSSLLTGRMFVSIDFFAGAPRAKVNWAAKPPQLPTMPGSLQEIQTALTSIAGKLDKLPLDKLSTDLSATLKTANGMLRRLDNEVAPQARDTLAEARKALGAVDRVLSSGQPVTQDARDTLREVGRAAQSLRVLSDYLERHPEALIRGKQEDEK